MLEERDIGGLKGTHGMRSYVGIALKSTAASKVADGGSCSINCYSESSLGQLTENVPPSATQDSVHGIDRGPVEGEILARAERQSWTNVQYRQGWYAGGSEQSWRTFVQTAPLEDLRLVLQPLCLLEMQQ